MAKSRRPHSHKSAIGAFVALTMVLSLLGFHGFSAPAQAAEQDQPTAAAQYITYGDTSYAYYAESEVTEAYYNYATYPYLTRVSETLEYDYYLGASADEYSYHDSVYSPYTSGTETYDEEDSDPYSDDAYSEDDDEELEPELLVVDGIVLPEGLTLGAEFTEELEATLAELNLELDLGVLDPETLEVTYEEFSRVTVDAYGYQEELIWVIELIQAEFPEALEFDAELGQYLFDASELVDDEVAATEIDITEIEFDETIIEEVAAGDTVPAQLTNLRLGVRTAANDGFATILVHVGGMRNLPAGANTVQTGVTPLEGAWFRLASVVRASGNHSTGSFFGNTPHDATVPADTNNHPWYWARSDANGIARFRVPIVTNAGNNAVATASGTGQDTGTVQVGNDGSVTNARFMVVQQSTPGGAVNARGLEWAGPIRSLRTGGTDAGPTSRTTPYTFLTQPVSDTGSNSVQRSGDATALHPIPAPQHGYDATQRFMGSSGFVRNDFILPSNDINPPVTIGTAPAATLITPTPSERMISSGTWVNRLANPAIPPQCVPLRAAIIVDISSSVAAANMVGDMRSGAQALARELATVNATVSAYSFGWQSGTSVAPNIIRPAGGGNEVARLMGENYWSFGTVGPTSPNLQATNWDAAFQAVARTNRDMGAYEVVFFLTDGNPTVSATTTATPPMVLNRLYEVEQAVFSANLVKYQGSRIVAVGVGNTSLLDNTSIQNLAAVSGDNVFWHGGTALPQPNALLGMNANFTSNIVDADIIRIYQPGELAPLLQMLAATYCGAQLTVIKETVPSSVSPDLSELPNPIPSTWNRASGWSITAAGPAVSGGVSAWNPPTATTGADGSVTFTIPFITQDGSRTVNVSESLAGHSSFQHVAISGLNAMCFNASGTLMNDANGNFGDRLQTPGVNFIATQGGNYTCYFRNRDVAYSSAQSVNAAGTFEGSWEWQIEKSEIEYQGAVQATTGDVTFTYQIVVTPTPTGATTHNYSVNATFQVTAGDSGQSGVAIDLTGLTGTTATFVGYRIDGATTLVDAIPNIAAGQTKTITAYWTLTGQPTNANLAGITARALFGDAVAATQAVTFTGPSARTHNTTATLTDSFPEFAEIFGQAGLELSADGSTVSPAGPFNGGTVAWENEAWVITYSADRGLNTASSATSGLTNAGLIAVCEAGNIPGTWSTDSATTFTNTAKLVDYYFTNGQTGTADALVCTGLDLEIVSAGIGYWTRAFNWTIEKEASIYPEGPWEASATQAADANNQATFYYQVTVTPTGHQDYYWVARGTATISNPNPWPVTVTSFNFTGLGEGTQCTFANVDVNLALGAASVAWVIPANTTTDFVIECAVENPTEIPVAEDDNTTLGEVANIPNPPVDTFGVAASIEWAATEGTLGGTDSATGTITWYLDEARGIENQTVHVFDNAAGLSGDDYRLYLRESSDTDEGTLWRYVPNGYLGSVDWSDGPITFVLRQTVPGDPDFFNTATHINKAWITTQPPPGPGEPPVTPPGSTPECPENDPWCDTAKVIIEPEPLTAVANLSGEFYQSYTWNVDKTVNPNTTVVLGRDDVAATFVYTLTVSASDPIYSDAAASGSVSVTNPNAFAVPLAVVSAGGNATVGIATGDVFYVGGEGDAEGTYWIAGRGTVTFPVTWTGSTTARPTDTIAVAVTTADGNIVSTYNHEYTFSGTPSGRSGYTAQLTDIFPEFGGAIAFDLDNPTRAVTDPEDDNITTVVTWDDVSETWTVTYSATLGGGDWWNHPGAPEGSTSTSTIGYCVFDENGSLVSGGTAFVNIATIAWNGGSDDSTATSIICREQAGTVVAEKYWSVAVGTVTIDISDVNLRLVADYLAGSSETTEAISEIARISGLLNADAAQTTAFFNQLVTATATLAGTGPQSNTNWAWTNAARTTNQVPVYRGDSVSLWEAVNVPADWTFTNVTITYNRNNSGWSAAGNNVFAPASANALTQAQPTLQELVAQAQLPLLFRAESVTLAAANAVTIPSATSNPVAANGWQLPTVAGGFIVPSGQTMVVRFTNALVAPALAPAAEVAANATYHVDYNWRIVKTVDPVTGIDSPHEVAVGGPGDEFTYTLEVTATRNVLPYTFVYGTVTITNPPSGARMNLTNVTVQVNGSSATINRPTPVQVSLAPGASTTLNWSRQLTGTNATNYPFNVTAFYNGTQILGGTGASADRGTATVSNETAVLTDAFVEGTNGVAWVLPTSDTEGFLDALNALVADAAANASSITVPAVGSGTFGTVILDGDDATGLALNAADFIADGDNSGSQSFAYTATLGDGMGYNDNRWYHNVAVVAPDPGTPPNPGLTPPGQTTPPTPGTPPWWDNQPPGDLEDDEDVHVVTEGPLQVSNLALSGSYYVDFDWAISKLVRLAGSDGEWVSAIIGDDAVRDLTGDGVDFEYLIQVLATGGVDPEYVWVTGSFDVTNPTIGQVDFNLPALTLSWGEGDDAETIPVDESAVTALTGDLVEDQFISANGTVTVEFAINLSEFFTVAADIPTVIDGQAMFWPVNLAEQSDEADQVQSVDNASLYWADMTQTVLDQFATVADTFPEFAAALIEAGLIEEGETTIQLDAVAQTPADLWNVELGIWEFSYEVTLPRPIVDEDGNVTTGWVDEDGNVVSNDRRTYLNTATVSPFDPPVPPVDPSDPDEEVPPLRPPGNPDDQDPSDLEEEAEVEVFIETLLTVSTVVAGPDVPVSEIFEASGIADRRDFGNTIWQLTDGEPVEVAELTADSAADLNEHALIRVPIEAEVAHAVSTAWGNLNYSDEIGAKYALQGAGARFVPGVPADQIGTMSCFLADVNGVQLPGTDAWLTDGTVAVPLGGHAVCQQVVETSMLSVRKIVMDIAEADLSLTPADDFLTGQWLVRISAGDLPAVEFDFPDLGRTWGASFDVDGFLADRGVPQYILVRPGVEYTVELLTPVELDAHFELVAHFTQSSTDGSVPAPIQRDDAIVLEPLITDATALRSARALAPVTFTADAVDDADAALVPVSTFAGDLSNIELLVNNVSAVPTVAERPTVGRQLVPVASWSGTLAPLEVLEVTWVSVPRLVPENIEIPQFRTVQAPPRVVQLTQTGVAHLWILGVILGGAGLWQIARNRRRPNPQQS